MRKLFEMQNILIPSLVLLSDNIRTQRIFIFISVVFQILKFDITYIYRIW